MIYTLKHGLFPWFSLLTGLVGFSLRSSLLSTLDENGLLSPNHIAGTLSFLLLAAVIGVFFFALRKETATDGYFTLFPASYFAAAGIFLSAICFSFSGRTLATEGLFPLLTRIFGILGGGALTVTAYCRMKGLRPSCLLHCLVAVFFILRIMTCCQAWGSEPQLQLYFFPLLACLFLLLACYYRAELDIKCSSCRAYLFFSQTALFLCCMCLPGEDWLFYLSAIVWLTTDFCVLPVESKTH